MTDPTADREAEEDADATTRDGGARTGMPPWVKISLIVVGVLIAVFIVLQIAGVGGQHGPRRHMSPGGRSSQSPSSDVSEHRPPPGMDHSR